MNAPPRRKQESRHISRFQSQDEEARSWETHSPLDYPEMWQEINTGTAKRRPLGHILAVRLDAKTIDRLAAIGRAKGIGPSTLARMWLLERLATLEEQVPKQDHARDRG